MKKNKKRQISRENALEAKNIVYQREERFFENLSAGIRYLVTAIAGGIVVILGFVGAVGSSVSNIWISAISLFPIFAGLVGGGVSIAISIWISQEDFKTSLTSFIEAMHNDAIDLFTDTAKGRDQKLRVLFLSWLISFVLFSIGAVWFGISLIFLDFEESDSPSQQSTIAAKVSHTEGIDVGSKQNSKLDDAHGVQDAKSETKSSDALPPISDEDKANVPAPRQAEEENGVLSGD